MPAYYVSSVKDLAVSDDLLLANLTKGYESDRYCDLKVLQISSWNNQIAALRGALEQCPESEHWGILLEFSIPRRMSRADAVLLIGTAVVVLEFKTEQVDSSAAEQVEDYALDLLQFHKPSQNALVYPIVVGADSTRKKRKTRVSKFPDIEPTCFTTVSDLAVVLNEVGMRHRHEVQRDIDEWNFGEYHPVPTIIESAVGLFRDMHVDDIAHSDADPINLGKTVERLRAIIRAAFENKQKSVCFVTGVPGAGKTLAGLKLVHDSKVREETDSQIAFLSGNGPLVEVLRGALAKDLRKRKDIHRRIANRAPKTLIQSVYGVKQDLWPRTSPPVEHIWVFDEAQRAWDEKHTARKLPMKDGKPCDFSEPGLLIHFLDRHADWCVLICLIGGGQEIHDGEAGLAEWGRAIRSRFPLWSVYASPAALDGSVGAGEPLFSSDTDDINVSVEPELHLDIPTRQFRGKTLSRWADAVVQGDSGVAESVLKANPEYPIVITRDIKLAKDHLASQRLGSERFGLVASSAAKRLRAEGIMLPAANEGDPASWFLAELGDIRSSFQMEVAATEFQVQGLELDWVCICWGGDFTWNDKWQLRELRGSKWTKVALNNRIRRSYMFNTYRVLLTRARQGMVLYVPLGDTEDETRSPEAYDKTFEFLVKCGAQIL
jgi:hypothetical protein